MGKITNWIRVHGIILAFALAKLLIHLLTATQYGFQRDAYLYLAQSQHLDWGYFSTAPLLAWITRLHTLIWGDFHAHAGIPRMAGRIDLAYF